MSQSETWDRLRMAMEFAAEGRDVEALTEMPEPDLEWKRRTKRSRCPRFWEHVPMDNNEERVPRGEQIVMARREVEGRDWLAWLNPTRTTSVDSILRGIYTDNDIIAAAMRDRAAFHVGMSVGRSSPRTSAFSTVVTAVDEERGVITLADRPTRQPHVYMNPTVYDRLRAMYTNPAQRRFKERFLMSGLRRSPRSIPRRNLIAALTALPGYRS